ncbi:MAG: ThuA domain-containing protein [Ignavibacteriae bacterium]|nr:ThuA domain-containing protein [Ignavibacteriota bacterium]
MNDPQKQAFLELLNKGKSILFLHHSLVSYQGWDEYEKIIGGRYYQSTNYKDSLKFTQSTYKHDVEIPVQIVDKNHPITKGLEDFIIHDEIYGKYKILTTVSPIFTTTHPESETIIGWTNSYGKSKIVYIQLGHDNHSFNDKNYRLLI